LDKGTKKAKIENEGSKIFFIVAWGPSNWEEKKKNYFTYK
jgi:hypothetical protein